MGKSTKINEAIRQQEQNNRYAMERRELLKYSQQSQQQSEIDSWSNIHKYLNEAEHFDHATRRYKPKQNYAIDYFRIPENAGAYATYILLFGMVCQFGLVEASAINEKKARTIDGVKLSDNNLNLSAVDSFTLFGSANALLASENNAAVNQGHTAKNKATKAADKPPSESKQLYKNNRNARVLIDYIKKIAPKKLNRPQDSRLIVTEDKILVEPSGQIYDGEQERLRETQLQEFIDTYDKNYNVVQTALREEIIAEARKYPFQFETEEEINVVNAEYAKLQQYVHKIQGFLLGEAVVKLYQGGNCGMQSAAVVAEALRRNIDIEFIELFDKTDPNGGHVFTVLGRKAGSVLNDPTTWGDAAVIIDEWGYDKAISIKELKQDPAKYNLYFYKNWRWESSVWSSKLPESLKGSCYKKYSQVKDAFSFCQAKIKELLKQKEMELPHKPVYAASPQLRK